MLPYSYTEPHGCQIQFGACIRQKMAPPNKIGLKNSKSFQLLCPEKVALACCPNLPHLQIRSPGPQSRRMRKIARSLLRHLESPDLPRFKGLRRAEEVNVQFGVLQASSVSRLDSRAGREKTF